MTTIDAIDVFPLPYIETNDHGSVRYSVLVRVRDSDGIDGWGEAATILDDAAQATAVIASGYASALLGTPATVASAHEVMSAHGWWHGGAGIASFAAAALDMALWDCEARRAGLPLSVYLGAPASKRLTTILTCHASQADLGLMTDTMAGWVRDHHTTDIKLAFGKAGDSRLGVDLSRDTEFARLLHSKLDAGARIMVDVSPRVKWTVQDALDRIHALRPHGLAWLEEPLGARNPEGYRTLHNNSEGVLIAYGEREWNVAGIADIIATGTVDVVGMDPGRIGVSGFLAGAQLCAAAGVHANAHAFAGPLIFASSLAASLATEAATEFEIAPLRNELWEIAGAPDLAPQTSTIGALGEPGLGFTVDEERVRAASAAWR